MVEYRDMAESFSRFSLGKNYYCIPRTRRGEIVLIQKMILISMEAVKYSDAIILDALEITGQSSLK
jgi:hypothetical protein